MNQYVALCTRDTNLRLDRDEFRWGTEIVFGPFSTPEGALAEVDEHNAQGDCDGRHSAVEIASPFTSEQL